MRHDLERRVIQALRQIAPSTIVEGVIGSAQAAVDRDLALLDEVLSLKVPAPFFRIWTNRPSIILSRRLVGSGSVQPAIDAARELGLSVAIRASGGNAVIHRPGILCVSRFFFLQQESALPGSDVYKHLLDMLITALRCIDIVADYGPVTNSYCDGKYNLRCAGRKVAGTAALVRRQSGRTACVAHASLSISGDLRADLAAISNVECAMGYASSYALHAHTTLHAECNMSRDGLLQRCGY